MLLVPLFFCVSAASMRVEPSSESDPPFKLTLHAAISSYRLSHATHGVFFWVIVSYFFISAGLQWERFLFFFVRDCIVPSATLAKMYASRTYLVTLVSCASGAIFYSALGFSRRFGNRRCFMLGTFLISGSTFVLIFVETTSQLYIAIAVLGVASGLMLSSSFALALEHIPHGHQESLRLTDSNYSLLISFSFVGFMCCR
jgi:MFS family permease